MTTSFTKLSLTGSRWLKTGAKASTDGPLERTLIDCCKTRSHQDGSSMNDALGVRNYYS